MAEPLFAEVAAATVTNGADPRITALLPRIERSARRFSSRYSFTLDPDDAVQMARVALWECARRAPEASVKVLAAYAWKRAQGAIFDALRVMNGGRRNAATHGGYGFAPELVNGARATGLLPQVATDWDGTVEPVCADPSPEEQVIAQTERRSWTAALPAKLRCLSDRDRIVVCLALLGIRGAEIGRTLGLTQARVSQILGSFAGTAPARKRRKKKPKR